MCQNNNVNDHDEVTSILEKIVALQKKAVREEIREEYCDVDFLGEVTCGESCNTRPIMLYTYEDKAWHCPLDRDSSECVDSPHEQTCVFRVEKVENGTCTLRALKARKTESCDYIYRYESTDSFITIKLACICALKCQKDCFVNICLR